MQGRYLKVHHPSTRFCPVLVHTQKVLGPASTSIFVERRKKDREVGWMDGGKDILGDPGADSGGEGKSKRAENMARRKVKNGEKSPWGQCLTRPVPNGRHRSGF